MTGVTASGAGAATGSLGGGAAAAGGGVFGDAGSADTLTVISVTLGPGVTVEGLATGACVFGATTVTGGAGTAPFGFVVAVAPTVGVPVVVAGGGVGAVPSVGVVPVVRCRRRRCRSALSLPAAACRRLSSSRCSSSFRSSGR